ncbi:MAG: hypothetical protein NZ772_11060 [Cyanobacteria bacterium]|nr:hypothetical protein [Cyanobacteriota bacterium]MDW8201991.1 hypothetical protein [Cyanobacteriota bacterium SKYGB_h_bin112]
MYFSILGFGGALAIALLLVFSVLQWLQVPAGNFVDWIIGAASFWWLLVVTPVPWNIYFDAKQVLAEAAVSAENGIIVEPRKLNYAQMVARRSLWIAITLHVLSAIGLYTLAALGISSVGYVSSGAALLLTALRPAIATYGYLSARLAMIRQDFKYPRDDIKDVLTRLGKLESDIASTKAQIDRADPRSWAVSVERRLESLRQDLTHLSSSQEELKIANQTDHQRLSREAEQAIARLSTDAQFLDHVREIIRFFKNA